MLISIYFARGELGRAHDRGGTDRASCSSYWRRQYTSAIAYQQIEPPRLLTRGRSREAQQYLERPSRSISGRVGGINNPRRYLLQFERPCGGPGDIGSRRSGCRVSPEQAVHDRGSPLPGKNCKAQIICPTPALSGTVRHRPHVNDDM